MPTGGMRVVETISSLDNSLKAVGEVYPKEVRAILRDEVKTVAALTRGNMRGDFGERSKSRRKARKKSGLAVSRVRATSAPTFGATSDYAWVGYNRRNRYVGWLDWGGTLQPTPSRGPGKRGRTNRIVRPLNRPGRYLYPAIIEQRPKSAARLARELETVMDHLLPQGE